MGRVEGPRGRYSASEMTLHVVVSLILYALIVLVAIDGGETDTLNAGQRYLVVRLHRLGLANRLRSMADLHLIATSSNRHMLISWLPTIDCNASFLDLFVSGMEGSYTMTSRNHLFNLHHVI